MAESSRQTVVPVQAVGAPQPELEQLRRQLRDLTLLHRITGFLHRTLDLDEIVRILGAALTAGSALGFNRAVLLRSRVLVDELVGWSAVGPLSGEEAARIWNAVSGRQSFEHIVQMASAARPGEGELQRRVRELRFPLRAGASVLADAVTSGTAIRVEQAGTDPRVPAALRALLETPALVVAPLCGDERVVGVVVADNRFSGTAIGDDDVELLESLARHAGLAIERAQAHARVERRLSERARLHEISKGILSTVELDRELELIAEASAQLIGAAWSTLWLCRDSSPTMRAAARFGARAVAFDGERLAELGRIARRAINQGKPVVAPLSGDDAADEVLCVPLTVLDHPVGAIAVGGAPNSGRFAEEDQETLALLGDQAAIAIQNARLFRRIRRTERRLRDAEAIRARTETLAALGEMSAKVSHEIRTPLASIGGFARLLVPHFAEGTNERRAADIIVDEAQRLERILTSQLDFVALSRPKTVACDLNRIVDAVLELMLEEAGRRRIRVLWQPASALPELLLDPDQMRQVVLNLVQNGLESLSAGGRLRIETRLLAAHVALDVATDGEPIPGELLDRLFVPFATSKRGGTGLGLAVAHQIVREHGGQIRARSGGEWGAIFTVILPLRGHGDRRQSSDRRRRIVDRRGALDPAPPAEGPGEEGETWPES